MDGFARLMSSHTLIGHFVLDQNGQKSYEKFTVGSFYLIFLNDFIYVSVLLTICLDIFLTTFFLRRPNLFKTKIDQKRYGVLYEKFHLYTLAKMILNLIKFIFHQKIPLRYQTYYEISCNNYIFSLFLNNKIFSNLKKKQMILNRLKN